MFAFEIYRVLGIIWTIKLCIETLDMSAYDSLALSFCANILFRKISRTVNSKQVNMICGTGYFEQMTK